MRLLAWFCKDELLEEIEGDLIEYYQATRQENSRFRSNMVFIFHVLNFLRPFAIKKLGQNSNTIIMYRSYFKFASRSILNERGYSLMNVLGLTIGIASSLLLLLYINSEKSYNQFHRDIDRIYQVMENEVTTEGIITSAISPGPLVDYFKEDMPEVEHMAAFTWLNQMLLSTNDQNFKTSGRWASEEFFQVFDLEFIEGQRQNALKDPSQIFISTSLKERIFGDRVALNKTVEVDGWGQFQIGGVFEDVPEESTIDFEFIMPYVLWADAVGWVSDWRNSGISGIVKLSEGVQINEFNRKIEGYLADKVGKEEYSTSIFLQAFEDRYLYSDFENGQVVGGRILYLRLFSAVAYFILIIAAINFMNLTSARATKRAKEVGVKKVLGSSRSQLRIQFIIESMIMSLLATLLASILVMLVIDPLNQLVGKSLQFSWLNQGQVLILLGIGLSVGALAGIYPAVVLSRFKPIVALKGFSKNNQGSAFLRKSLVVFQFTISSVLILSTLVVRSQMDYIAKKELGYDKEHLITFPVEGDLLAEANRNQLKQRISSNPIFTNISFSAGSPIDFYASTRAEGFSWEGKSDDSDMEYAIINTDEAFFKTYGMEIIAGRAFNKDIATDTLNVVINQQTANLMKLDEPVGTAVSFWGRPGRVIGIVKDFHFQSLHESIKPLIISNRPDYPTMATVKISGRNIQEGINYLDETVTELNPSYAFEYNFFDDAYLEIYQAEATIGELMNYFSGIAIFISLLGVFGLSSFSAEQRIKEIGVRKVLGAKSLSLVFLMTGGFILLMGIGFVLAAPIAYSLMQNWLSAFEYAVEIGLWVFVFAALISMFITILTVSYHALKTTYANPIKSLRYE